MVEKKGMERFAPLAGLLYLVLAVVSFSIAGDPPGADAPAPGYAAHWAENDVANVISAIIGALAAVAFLWFAGSVREIVARVEPAPARLGSLALAGGAVMAAGLLTNSAIQFAAAEVADEVSPQVTQTLGLFYENFFFPMAGGIAVFLLAAGIGAVRWGAFDKRLGWIAIGLAAIAITPLGFIAFIGSAIWVGLASVVLYRKKDPVGSGAAPPSGPAPNIEVPPGAGPLT